MVTILLLTICSLLKAPEYRTLYISESSGINPLEQLFKAICTVESDNNPNALNRKELAYGVCQIRYIRLHDFNKRTGSHYVLKDMYDPWLSKKIFLWYAHQGSDLETIAKKWNGSGRKTEQYWQKVEKHLNTTK